MSVWSVDFDPTQSRVRFPGAATDVRSADYVRVILVPATLAVKRVAFPVRLVLVQASRARSGRVCGLDEEHGYTVVFGFEPHARLQDAESPRVPVGTLGLWDSKPGADVAQVFELDAASLAASAFHDVLGDDAALVQDVPLLPPAKTRLHASCATGAFLLEPTPRASLGLAVLAESTAAEDDGRLAVDASDGSRPDSCVHTVPTGGFVGGFVGEDDGDFRVIVGAASNEVHGPDARGAQEHADVRAAGFSMIVEPTGYAGEADVEGIVLESPASAVQELKARFTEGWYIVPSLRRERFVRASDDAHRADGNLPHEPVASARLLQELFLEEALVGAARAGFDVRDERVARVAEALKLRIEMMRRADELQRDGAFHVAFTRRGG